MANNFKKVIDRMLWVSVPNAPANHGTGASMTSDLRSDVSRNPYVYYCPSTNSTWRFNIVTKAWDQVDNMTVGGSITFGSAMIFAPSGSTSGFVVSAANPSTLTLLATQIHGLNTLANRGGSGEYGFKLRIIGKTSGKTEERFIAANENVVSGSNFVVVLEQPLTFTPSINDEYELLAGRYFKLNAGTFSNSNFRGFNVENGASTTYGSGSAPSSVGITTSHVVLDEQYTPYDCHPGEGMIKGGYLYDSGLVDRYALVATGAGSTTLTGQAVSGDSHVVTNEYRNFQIRIVEDTTTPAAVGQRRIIADNTAGPSPLYTLGSSWTTTPSANAKYVIELPNLILLRTNNATPFYAFNYTPRAYTNSAFSIAANSWSQSFASFASTHSYGAMAAPCWGIRPDTSKISRHSYVYFFRANSSSLLDRFDLAGANNGAWTGAVTYDFGSEGMNQGTCGVYDSISNEGRMFYINRFVSGNLSQIKRFDVQNLTVAPFVSQDYFVTGSATDGVRMAAYAAIDGNDAYTNLLLLQMGSSPVQELTVLA